MKTITCRVLCCSLTLRVTIEPPRAAEQVYRVRELSQTTCLCSWLERVSECWQRNISYRYRDVNTIHSTSQSCHIHHNHQNHQQQHQHHSRSSFTSPQPRSIQRSGTECALQRSAPPRLAPPAAPTKDTPVQRTKRWRYGYHPTHLPPAKRARNGDWTKEGVWSGTLTRSGMTWLLRPFYR
jgi:hypothetical protein